MIKRLVQAVRPGFAVWLAVAALAGMPGAWAQTSATPVAAPAAPTAAPTAAIPAATPAAKPAAPIANVRPAAQVSAPTTPAPAASTSRVTTDLHIIEDEQVRIEEARVRGQLQRVTVAPKGSALKPYEINVGAAGRDPSQDKSSAGQRVWSVLRF